VARNEPFQEAALDAGEPRNNTETYHSPTPRRDAIGRASKTTAAKRDREKALQMQRKEKEAKRALRKAEKAARESHPEGEDPDLAGLRWGPQSPLF
jgi:hypothetical protein